MKDRGMPTEVQRDELERILKRHKMNFRRFRSLMRDLNTDMTGVVGKYETDAIHDVVMWLNYLD